jgi:hypothetical protein
VAEGARLESVFRGNSNVGSNPTLSAIVSGKIHTHDASACNSQLSLRTRKMGKPHCSIVLVRDGAPDFFPCALFVTSLFLPAWPS